MLESQFIMKMMSRGLYIIGVVAALLSVVGCSKSSDAAADSNQSAAQMGYGTVSLSAAVSGSVAIVETRVESMYELPEAIVPTSADFAMTLSGSYVDPSEEDESLIYKVEKSYDSFDSYNEELPQLYTNDDGYSVTVSYGDSSVEGENMPSYYGQSVITVVARTNSRASIEASLVNSIFTFATSEWFDLYYTDAEFTITTSAGSEFTFGKGVDERLIFVEAGTELTLSGSATKTNGSSVTFAANKIGVTTSGVLTSIKVDASQAGSQTISVTFDGTIVETEEQEVEFNQDA